jgi:hypothetical protein
MAVERAEEQAEQVLNAAGKAGVTAGVAVNRHLSRCKPYEEIPSPPARTRPTAVWWGRTAARDETAFRVQGVL